MAARAVDTGCQQGGPRRHQKAANAARAVFIIVAALSDEIPCIRFDGVRTVSREIMIIITISSLITILIIIIIIF